MTNMNADIENHIRQNHTWTKLPANLKQVSTYYKVIFDKLWSDLFQISNGHLSKNLSFE